jgi:SlyX protein
MTDQDLTAHIESLESRLMHQEAAIEELTRTLVKQEQLVNRLVTTIDGLESQIRSLTAANLATSGEESPPPHY